VFAFSLSDSHTWSDRRCDSAYDANVELNNAGVSENATHCYNKQNSQKFIVTIPVRKPLMKGVFVKSG